MRADEFAKTLARVAKLVSLQATDDDRDTFDNTVKALGILVSMTVTYVSIISLDRVRQSLQASTSN
jgi:hypothetical protein